MTDFKINEKDISANCKLLILIAENTQHTEIFNLFQYLDSLEIEYMGGIFPSVIYKDNYYNSGFIVKYFNNIEFAAVLSMDSENVEIPVYNEKEISSLILVDGLSPNIKDFLNLLFTNYTDTIKYFGGGAGSLKPNNLLPIFHKGKFYENSALVILLETDAELFIDHGWYKMDGPFLVTSSQQNILKEINWQSALSFYEEIIFEKTGLKLNENNFFDVTKAFPLGIETEDENIIVRDPWKIVDDEDILCVSDIPNNSTIYILNGDAISLLKISKRVRIQNRKSNSLLFDCVSRALFLEKNFDIELLNISSQTQNDVIGVLSIGEISTTTKGKLAFLNKTLVYCEFD